MKKDLKALKLYKIYSNDEFSFSSKINYYYYFWQTYLRKKNLIEAKYLSDADGQQDWHSTK